LTDFSSANGAFGSFKGTEVGNESNVDLTQHYSEPTDSTKAVSHRVYLTWKQHRRWIEVVFQGDLTDFSSANGAFSSFKRTEEGNESHVDLTQIFSKPTDTSNTVFHRIYLTWKHPRRWIELVFQGDLTDFSSANGAFGSFKGTEVGNESNVDLTQHYSVLYFLVLL